MLLPHYLPQSWTRSRPLFHDPTCPSLNSSTAGTSGRTCVCSASPRKSSLTRSLIHRSCRLRQSHVSSTASQLLTLGLCVLPPSDSSLTASVTVTARFEVTSEAPPPVFTGCTCCLCAQEAVPGCCSGRPWTGAVGVAFCSSP